VKIIPFPSKPATGILPFSTNPERPRPGSDLGEILIYLRQMQRAVLVFIDGSKDCRDYAYQSPWTKGVAVIIHVDRDIANHFQIEEFPQWCWFENGREVHHHIGFASEEEIRKNQKMISNVFEDEDSINSTTDLLCGRADQLRLSRDSDLEEILACLDIKPLSVILFVDGQKFCQQYSEFPWIAGEAEVIEVDQEIVDHFQIDKVPQWRFYVKGSEVHHLIGSADEQEFRETYLMVLRSILVRTCHEFG
jgi:hypothetical protein